MGYEMFLILRQKWGEIRWQLAYSSNNKKEQEELNVFLDSGQSQHANNLHNAFVSG